mmetsp:Transcript_21679/g.47143  ORF Transcript_21679/g.47143 Transcript_21679/m.47143 type:complete len:203 (+) Transcript_21679:299-907(+)
MRLHRSDLLVHLHNHLALRSQLGILLRHSPVVMLLECFNSLQQRRYLIVLLLQIFLLPSNPPLLPCNLLIPLANQLLQSNHLPPHLPMWIVQYLLHPTPHPIANLIPQINIIHQTILHERLRQPFRTRLANSIPTQFYHAQRRPSIRADRRGKCPCSRIAYIITRQIDRLQCRFVATVVVYSRQRPGNGLHSLIVNGIPPQV